jgi:hypothetical protein
VRIFELAWSQKKYSLFLGTFRNMDESIRSSDEQIPVDKAVLSAVWLSVEQIA